MNKLADKNMIIDNKYSLKLRQPGKVCVPKIKRKYRNTEKEGGQNRERERERDDIRNAITEKRGKHEKQTTHEEIKIYIMKKTQ